MGHIKQQTELGGHIVQPMDLVIHPHIAHNSD